MHMEHLPGYVMTFLEVASLLFIFIIGVLALTIVILYIIDRSQTHQTIRHNFPVIGRFRYLFETLGECLRQYFFAMDREELPFNRAERSWVYRAAKNVDNTAAFGSTRDLHPVGTALFVNCPFPTLGKDAAEPSEITIGGGCDQPYRTRSLFNISGMSYGAISRPAVQALSNGARVAGCWQNTGEGGLTRWHLEGGADLVFQIGTAKYGVRDEHGRLSDAKLAEIAAHEQVRMFEVKLSQGAKPGKGGLLPGTKVNEEIASIRGIPVYTDSISPNRHVDIDKVDDLLDMLDRIRRITGKPVGFKTVLGGIEWLDDLFSLIHHRGTASAPDFITVDSADGGSGAAPMSLLDNVGLPVKEALPLVVDQLGAHGLRGRIKLIASGKLITPAEVAWALAAGADFVTSARGFMFALGCIQALQCNKNTCPTGVTTHDKRLQTGLDPRDKAERVAHYARSMVHEVGVIAHSCGVSEPRQSRRSHVRMVTADGNSILLSKLYPETGDDTRIQDPPINSIQANTQANTRASSALDEYPRSVR